MRRDPGPDRDDTLYDHPANRCPLSETGLLEESSFRTNLHGHAVKVPANVKSLRPVGPVAGAGSVTLGLAAVARANELTRILLAIGFALEHLRATRFVIDDVRRSKLGIVERAVAHKP